MINFDLTENWTLRNVTSRAVPDAVDGRDVPATVPGCVHTDLLAADLIPDPYHGQNELGLQWIGENDWQYRCRFDVSVELLEKERLELVCEGLDTVATVELNGHVVGRSENMHLAYRFDAKPYVRAGTNHLSITFRSALAYAHEQVERLGYLPNSSYPHPFNFIRKMACNFGWDWGPTLITAGVWQPICLEAWQDARIASVRPLVTEAREEEAVAEVYVEVEGIIHGLELVLTLRDPAGDVVVETRETVSSELQVSHRGGAQRAKASLSETKTHSATVSATVTVKKPQLWWPVGHGAQPLYTLQVELKRENTTLESRQHRIGLRRVRLNTDVDAIGSAFALEINGKPVFCKGANWIPDDCFVTRVTPERYRERVTQALDANMNMLRVWGGGIYEQDAFYEACDELGIMVWQDFLFACALYPEEEPFGSLVEAEARYQLTRLSRHPSLVLWNGNNENLWGYFDWERDGKTWLEWAEGRSWGAGFYFELFPELVSELDPSRPYTPGSPFSGSLELHPGSDNHGTTHMWDVWNALDYTAYRSYIPRFAAEFGFQAPPTFATLLASLPEDERHPESAAMLHHQKADRGNEKLARGLARHFASPETFDDWHFLTQLNQARALQLGVEWFRAHGGRCMGTLYWQLNDCWPATSWAAVDGYGRKKLLWYATKRFYADRLLSVQPHGNALFLHLVNDTDEVWATNVTTRRLAFSGAVCAEATVPTHLAPRAVKRVRLEPALAHTAHPTTELLTAAADGLRTFWYFARDRSLQYPRPEFEATLEKTSQGYVLNVAARTFVRDLCLLVDKLEPAAATDSQLLTLLPGETGAFRVQTDRPLTLEACLAPTVLYSANRFGDRSGPTSRLTP